MKIIASFFSSVILIGCSYGAFTNTPPIHPESITNAIEVNKSKDSTWNQLVAGLASNFFVINTMDNKSGLINLSFTADPEAYIDGGELHYATLNRVDQSDTIESFDFPASRAIASYDIVSSRLPVSVNRQLQLKGKMNLLVSELSSTRSRLTANISYILILNVTGGVNYNETLTFLSGQSVKSGLDSVVYRSNGKLEQSILNMVE